MAAQVAWSLRVWKQAHANCGRGCGPYADARVHMWQVHRCSCGAKLYVPEEQIPRGDDALGEVS